MSRTCFFTEDGRINQFSCSLSQQCCEDDCCNIEFTFYTHWYFWVAVVVLVMFFLAAVISGYCKHRRQPPPYRMLNTVSGQGTPPFIPWVWGLDEESNAPDFQPVHTSRPFLFPYGQHRTSSHTTVTETSQEATVT